MRKSQYEQYFHGKKITAMGIGLLGRGYGDIAFMAECGANIIATDLQSKKTLKESLNHLKGYKNISYTLDRHLIGDFRNRDMIIHAAGIKKNNKYLHSAHVDNTPVQMSFSVLVDILQKEKMNVKIIGVTGTKGKSSTVGMIEAILKKAGLTYHLAGNIRGVSNLPLLKKIKKGDIILAELDSWQLQGLHDISFSPDISVFTNFFEDHMNYYDNSMQDYFNDKSAIYKYQNSSQHLVYSTQAKQAISQYSKTKPQGHKVIGKYSKLPKNWSYILFGVHNEQNFSLAYEVGKILKVPMKIIKSSLCGFKGVEGRFQNLGTSKKRNLTFFNDNNSTTPSSTIQSIISLKIKYPERNIVMIGGGSDKNFNYKELADFLPNNVEHMFLFPGKATEKIYGLFPKNFKNFTTTLSMRTAFNLALRQANDGDIIILSPAASSFGLFQNEYQRNDQFVQRVKQYLRK